MEPGFPRSVTVYGVGLIGGSIALALKKHFPATRVYGVDNPETLQRAESLGMLDKGDYRKSDLTILATPVTQILELLETLDTGSPLIVDVGSTKVEICKKAEEKGLPFIGAHPMTGTEKTGPEAASADLFAGAPFFFCPIRTTPDWAAPRLSEIVRALGGNPLVVEARDHDRIVAQISHLPQLLSTLLADYALDNLSFAGPGMKSMTRLAASPFHVWRDIFRTSGFLPHELEGFADRLRLVLNALESGDLESIQKIFERANRAASGGSL
jgi:prephenate dehydrogenase